MSLGRWVGTERNVRKRKKKGKCEDCGKKLSTYNTNPLCFACIDKMEELMENVTPEDFKEEPNKKPRRKYRRRKPKFTGLEPDAPITVNKKGGKQSDTIYRCDLLDPAAMLSVCAVLNSGAEKYGEDNWRNLSINENLNHLLMHVFAYLNGDTSDDHLSHAACRAIFALAKELRPNYKGRT